MSKSGKLIGLPIVNARAAGIDIGSRIQVASVPPELSDDPVRTFQSFTADIEAMANWLVSVGITTVAMESTGVYWIPLYELLDTLLSVQVDALTLRPAPSSREMAQPLNVVRPL